MKRVINIPIFVSHQGCPNNCVFCNQKRITGIRSEETEGEIRQKIERFLTTCRTSEAEKEIAYFGGSFTGIEAEKQAMYLQIAQPYIQSGEVKGIRVSTRPDYINPEICERLHRNHVTTIELGVQSADDEVLRQNRRGMKASDTESAVKVIRQYPFSLGLQMMTGMLGSEEKKDLFTARELIRLRPDFVRIYPTVILRDTALYERYLRGEYVPMKLEDSVRLSAELLDLFEVAEIPVIRLGLMAGEEIHETQVAGPYHSSYRELVESYRICRTVEQFLQGRQTEGKVLEIVCAPSMVSKVIGNRRKNVLLWQETYGVRVLVTQSREEPHFRIQLLESADESASRHVQCPNGSNK